MRLVTGVYFIFITFMFVRCHKLTEIDELIKQTNKIQIVLSDSSDFTEITDRSAIKKFDDFISDEDSPVYQCGFDGNIIFFTSAGSVIMNYVLKDDCAHVEYLYGSILKTKKITAEGLNYFRTLNKQ